MTEKGPSYTKTCEWCGAINPPAAGTCHRCDAVLRDASTRDQSAAASQPAVLTPGNVAPSQQEPDAEAASRPQQHEQTVARRRGTCDWCGAENLDSEVVCRQCSAALTDDSGAAAPATAATVAPVVAPGLDQRTLGMTIANLGLVVPFASGRLRANLAVGFLVLSIVREVADVMSTSSQIELLTRTHTGFGISGAEAAANDARQTAVALVGAIVYLATAVFFLMWIHRAHRNLPSLGAVGLKYSPGWAVGGFFVPFLNLVRPYQVVQEVWRASDPEADPGDHVSWRLPRSSPLILVWWVSWLAMNFVAYASRRGARANATIDNLITRSWIEIAHGFIGIVAAVLAIPVIRQINDFQERKAERIAVLTQRQENSV